MSQYKVIEIIDEYSLIVNYGFNNNAEIGDELRIYAEGGPVIDPQTKEVLGTLDIIKDTVRVVVPYENFSICKKQATIEVPILNPLSEMMRRKTTTQKIDVDLSEASNRQITPKSPIQVGDSVLLLPK